MRYRDKRIYSVSDFLAQLKRRNRIGQPVWYRGHGRTNWRLEPTISRIVAGIAAESPLITRFKQDALALIAERPASEWEWLFVMRHHGVPTRLMDWSESPLVGLYFAVNGHPKSDGVVWNFFQSNLTEQPISVRDIHRKFQASETRPCSTTTYHPALLMNRLAICRQPRPLHRAIRVGCKRSMASLRLHIAVRLQ